MPRGLGHFPFRFCRHGSGMPSSPLRRSL
jgi:hypothetical protein